MPGQPDRTRDGRERCDEIRLHADALCRCVWADHVEEAEYHRRELERLERQQP
jgi:hypothetical protein